MHLRFWLKPGSSLSEHHNLHGSIVITDDKNSIEVVKFKARNGQGSTNTSAAQHEAITKSMELRMDDRTLADAMNDF